MGKNLINYFAGIKLNELLFNVAVLSSILLNYVLLILINKNTGASEYYLVTAFTTSLISILSLGLSKSILRYLSFVVLRRAIISSFIAILIASIVVIILYDLKYLFIPFIGLIDLALIFLRKKGDSLRFLLLKILTPTTTIVSILLFEFNFLISVYISYFLTLVVFVLTSIGNRVDYELNFISFKAQAKYSIPLSVNEALRTVTSYADQIILGFVASLTDLSGYTLLIRLSIAIRTLLSLPHVRLLPVILENPEKRNMIKVAKQYLFYVSLISLCCIGARTALLKSFNISIDDYGGLFYILIIIEFIRSISGFIRLKYSITEKTIFNLYSNGIQVLVVICLFYPLYLHFGVLGLIFTQLIGALCQLLFDYFLIKRYV